VSNAYGKAAWRKACNRAGLAGLRFHDPRHTWASWLMQAGAPAYAIHSLGGWASPKMVERYAHLSPERLKQYAAYSKLKA
jgi:integrase